MLHRRVHRIAHRVHASTSRIDVGFWSNNKNRRTGLQIAARPATDMAIDVAGLVGCDARHRCRRPILLTHWASSEQIQIHRARSCIMKTSRNYLLALRLSLLACVLPLSIGSTSALADPPAATAAEEALAKENYLNNYIRPETVRRSFHTAEGMWVDCVDVNRQPGMLTPDMAGKTVEQPPPPPARHDDRARVLPHGGQLAVLDTELHANEADENGVVRRCEEGTIPIRRRTPEELSRFPNLRDMFSKGRGHPFKSGSDSPSPKFYEHAGSSQSVTNWGMQFFMNIWSPTTNSSDHSISQMWVLNSAVTDSAEAGWTVDPGQFGDNKPHLFIYWTDNGYNSAGVSGNAGCYDLDCAGFVQTSNTVTLGGTFNATSSPGGTQVWAEVTWAKSSATGNWWFFYQGKPVGYIPASKYTHGMQTQADLVEFGGEVNSPNNPPGGTHTTTQMGSGKFPSTGCGQAAFQSHVQYVNTNYNTVDVTPNGNIEDTLSSCYNYSTGYEKSATCYSGTQSTFQNGYFEFFGGPGYSTSCPTTPAGD
jgi:hypothetical protein